MINISIQLPVPELERLMNGYTRALARGTVDAINKAAAIAQTAGAKQVREDYIIKARDLKSNTSMQKASGLNPEAVINIKGKRIPLFFFQTSRNSVGIRVRVKRSGAARTIPHVFYVWSARSGRGRIQEREGRPRLPIGARNRENSAFRQNAELLGPSVPQMYQRAVPLIQKTFRDRVPGIIAHEVKYRKSKL